MLVDFDFSKKDQPKKRMSVVKEGDDEDVGIQIKASKDGETEKALNADNVDCLSSSSCDVEKGRQPNGDVKKER